MEPKKPVNVDPKRKTLDTGNEEKDENEIVSKVENVVEKESFTDRDHGRKHQSPVSTRNPKTAR